MSLNQKVVTGGGMAALLAAALFISTIGDRMVRYTALFGQLDPRSAGELAARLDQENVTYRLSQGGSAIEVPIEEADRLKVKLAAEGLPQSGVVGYEILDTTNFGMSDFLQKINYKRALEGELAKTLRTFDEIENARVHIVIPEPTLYTDAVQPPTASVVLDLKSNRTLPQRSVEAIANLVASAAVAGLDPASVKILDTRGNLLSRPEMDELALESSTVMDLKFSYERVMAAKVRDLICGAFGTGICLVTVNAELDFDRLERETTTYDQDGSAVVSEERTDLTNPDADGGGEESTTTNYNNGQIVEKLVQAPGSTVRRLTVTVMVDDRTETLTDDNGESTVQRVSWTPEELNRMRALSEAAIGLDTGRGDRLEIENFSFATRETVEEIATGMPLQATIVESVRAIGLTIAILAALGVLLLIVRSIAGALDPSRIIVAAEYEAERYVPPEVEDDVQAPTERAEIVRKIKAKAQRDPESVAKTIRTMYHEG